MIDMSRKNKKLCRLWDSTTCESLDAILSAEFDGFRTQFWALPVDEHMLNT